MSGLKEVLNKFPVDLRDAIVEFYDFLREEYIIKREEFEELKKVVENFAISHEKLIEQVGKLAFAQQKTEERLNELIEAQRKTEERVSKLELIVEKLAEAQAKTEERLNELAEAQAKTEERLSRLEEVVERLAEAQRKTEERLNSLTSRVEELSIAQKKTEEELRSLTITVKNIQKEVGGLSHSVGFDLENQAYKALPKILKERYGIEVKDRLLRKFIEYSDGTEEEINIYGKGNKKGKEIFIIGESKTNLSKKDVDKFKKRLERIKKVIKDEIFPIFVVHSSSPKIVNYAETFGFPVFFSYEF